ncbi:sensor domain-containing protein [Lentzea sp. NPDC051838]|uniref:sensor histidine kinase n=1 Tax=Lentzea sp. NPDC051838 TaxID=3154849 RepID=UPI00341EDDBC
MHTIWGSMARPGFLLSAWPWRGVAYLLSTPVVAAFAGVWCLPWLYLGFRLIGGEPALGEVTLTALGGLLAVAAGPLIALPVATVERLRLRLVGLKPVPRPRPNGLLRRYTDPMAWREVGYLAVVSAAALPSAALALTLVVAVSMIVSPLVVEPGSPLALGVGQAGTASEALPYALLGLVLLAGALYLAAGLAGLHGVVARRLLSDERLRTQLVEISQSRQRLVTAFEAERRRIERDLHDGAQQRLVSLILQLGMAKVEMQPDSPGTEFVTAAHEQAKQVLVELRELIHGIHPQALSDLGLPAALQNLADRSPTPVSVDCEIPERPSDAVESAGYFVVAEALSNAGKHSGATEIKVSAVARHDVLTVEITDNGRGGADAGRGSGLTGLADRAAAIGGTLSLSSPLGGPTTVRAEFPCT